MPRSFGCPIACLVLLVSVSCTRSDRAKITPDPAPEASVVAPAPSPAPVPSFVTASCAKDGDCGWDDECFPHACVAKPSLPNTCDESGPRPGRCICADDRCTLMRTMPTTGAKKTGCTVDSECAFDPPTGSCIAGSAPPFVRAGGFCTCRAATGTCVPELVDPVPCTSNTDCSFLEHPRRPAPAAKVPRPFPPVVPCKTGEFDSVCVAGKCQIRVWKC